MDLFVRLHGMLFTRIQLDDLPTVMSRFLERLEEDASLDGVSRKATITQVDWMLMATTNITALLQYGSGLGIIRKALAQEGAERRRQHASATGEGEEEEDGQISGESDGHHQSPTLDQPEPTLSFSFALELSYAILDHSLQHPRRLQGMTYVLNPYITLSLTFMATLFRQSHVGSMISTGLPWVRLVDFINTCPDEIREEARLVNGAPLPEDWCIRGMEWVGRRVYERGFWKAKGSGRGSGAMAQPKLGERFSSEMDVLLANLDSAVDSNEGVVDEIDGTDLTDGPVAVNQRRWRRVAWAAGVLVKHVDGLELVDGRVVIRGVLADKLAEVEAERMAKADRMNVPPPIPARVLEEMEELDLESESEGEDPDLAVLRVCSPLNIVVDKADDQGTTPSPPLTCQWQYPLGSHHQDQTKSTQNPSTASHPGLYYARIRYQRPLIFLVPLFQIG
jgi:protein SMG6